MGKVRVCFSRSNQKDDNNLIEERWEFSEIRRNLVFFVREAVLMCRSTGKKAKNIGLQC